MFCGTVLSRQRPTVSFCGARSLRSKYLLPERAQEIEGHHGAEQDDLVGAELARRQALDVEIAEQEAAQMVSAG